VFLFVPGRRTRWQILVQNTTSIGARISHEHIVRQPGRFYHRHVRERPGISDAENATEPLTSDGYGVSTPGGHLTTTFGGPPAVGFVGGGGYPTTAAGGLLSATGRTSGASAMDAINNQPTPTISGFAPATSFGDGHLVMNAGARSSAPGFAGGPPAASGGHHAVSTHRRSTSLAVTT